jgi:soluble lytic murein transglycosylase-like protein
MTPFRRLLPLLCGGFIAPLYGAPAPDELTTLLNKADPAQQTALATRYEHGEGVPQDYTRALHLYCAAAKKGYALAQYQLGWMYANGRGVARDDGQAAAWLRLAAAQGDRYAQQLLPRLDDPKVRKTAVCSLPGKPEPLLPHFAGLPKPLVAPAEVTALVNQLAPRYSLDPTLVLLVIETESGFQNNARSPKNALGLMQLIPATAERFGVRDPFDPVQNLHGGMSYLRWLLAFFEGDLRLALAGYNAGEQSVVKYGGVPPFAETQAYVERITRRYGRATHPPVPRVVEPAALVRPG